MSGKGPARLVMLSMPPDVQGELQQRVGGAGRIVERVRERDLGQPAASGW